MFFCFCLLIVASFRSVKDVKVVNIILKEEKNVFKLVKVNIKVNNVKLHAYSIYMVYMYMYIVHVPCVFLLLYSYMYMYMYSMLFALVVLIVVGLIPDPTGSQFWYCCQGSTSVWV